MNARGYLESLLADTYVKRVRVIGLSLTDNADVYQSLLVSKDDPNHDLVTDGTNIAECETGSRIIDLRLKIVFTVGSSGDMTEVALWRDKDAGITTSFTISALFNSDYTLTNEEVKGVCMWYDMLNWGSGSDKQTAFPRIRRAAMARNKRLREGDVLKLLFSQNDGSLTRKANIVGRITVAK